MLLRVELAYAAGPAEVFEMLADPAFRRAVSEAQDVVSHDVSIERDGDGFTLVNDQVQRTEGLPAIAQKFTGDTTRAVQREEWPDATGGRVTIDAPGKPSQISGTIALAPDGTGTVETVALDVRVKVPLVGGKLEQLLHDEIARSLETEHQVGQAWLAGDH